ncbi:[FeFe] hydrogenase H-cluster radical SAM maturase HydG [Bacteroidia bacterium]|nr:[FeFe] hydrogenase H-cluster radical SAM maturase HydG [Bacteroidia bacterium]
MKFIPEHYQIEDHTKQPFINDDELWSILNNTISTHERVLEIIDKSLSKKRLSLTETAVLINAQDAASVEAIKAGARQLKKNVYGNRIVLFAPLYVGNRCINNCLYCGFRSSNKEAERITLTDNEVIQEVEALEEQGQKRLILVYGEHPQYDAKFIAHTVDVVYGVKKNHGAIRRVNINAAPLDIEGFKIVKAAGIGTYQIFQETYNHTAYQQYHKGGKKMDYDYRLTALDRAQEAGIDDVGIGALFGLYDWRFELLGLVRHTNHLEACFQVGPHTISFPRIQNFSEEKLSNQYRVSDDDFLKLIAILRLAVPYTGLILTARESERIRNEAIQYGVSQIDGGTKLELGTYSQNEPTNDQNLHREQFQINDNRSLSEIIEGLIEQEFLPSFCTACYRQGRTGEHFMEFSIPGFIKRYCTPNAILTLSEYLCDYATPQVAEKGWALINKELAAFDNDDMRQQTADKVALIKQGQRDIYF